MAVGYIYIICEDCVTSQLQPCVQLPETGRMDRYAALASARRGTWHDLFRQAQTMTVQESRDSSGAGAADALTGVSAFAARVLNQLSLSAWLPSAFLTVAGSFLLQFRAQRSLNFADAAASLTKHPPTVLILALPVLVSTTLVTQAFAFEAIRILEGYWHRPGIPVLARNIMIRWHVRRRTSLRARRKKAAAKAFANIRKELLEKIPRPVVDALESDALGIDRSPLPTEYSRFEEMNWRSRCNAWELARVDHLLLAEQDYPPQLSRILPTRLGNIIRATEDRLQHVGPDVEGFVLRRRNLVSGRIRQQHDQFRARLEMYCILVFVAVLLVILTPSLLLELPINKWEVLAMMGGFAAVAFASYQAAVASAKGYCVALKQMDNPEPATSKTT